MPPLRWKTSAKALREQIRARLLAADAAGAEHRDLLVLCRIERARGKIRKFAEAIELRIERALERAERDFEGVAGIDHVTSGDCDQRVPVLGVDISAGLGGRIERPIADGDDLFLQPHFQPLERRLLRGREFQFEIVEPAAE